MVMNAGIGWRQREQRPSFKLKQENLTLGNEKNHRNL